MSHGRTHGRRRALGVCAAGLGAVAALGGGAPARAAATPAPAGTVVTATVYTGSSGLPSTRSVSAATLQACPAYAGPGALTLEPQGNTDTLAQGATWTLAEIVDCGLSVPLSDVAEVQVLRPSGAAEAPLSPAQLSDPAGYADPAAPGALPVVSNDGGQAVNIYTRPWRGGGDANAADQISASGPIALDVYESAAPLVVHITHTALHRGTSSERIALGATVQTASGATVPAAGLRWQWTLSTGTSSAQPAPSATIPGAATTTVSVQVSDPADGTGGTADVALAYTPTRARTATHDGGGGTNRRTSVSGLGASSHRSGSHPARGAAHGSGTATRTSPGTGTATPATTRTATTATTATSAPTATAPTGATGAGAATTTHPTPTTRAATTTTTTAPTAPPHPARRAHRRATARPRGRLVRGRLIGTLAAARAPAPPPPAATPSPAAAVASSPDVAGHFTLPGAVLAGAIVVALLGLGASRERYTRSRRLHR